MGARVNGTDGGWRPPSQSAPLCVSSKRNSGWLRVTLAVGIPFLVGLVVLLVGLTLARRVRKRKLANVEDLVRQLEAELVELKSERDRRTPLSATATVCATATAVQSQTSEPVLVRRNWSRGTSTAPGGAPGQGYRPPTHTVRSLSDLTTRLGQIMTSPKGPPNQQPTFALTVDPERHTEVAAGPDADGATSMSPPSPRSGRWARSPSWSRREELEVVPETTPTRGAPSPGREPPGVRGDAHAHPRGGSWTWRHRV